MPPAGERKILLPLHMMFYGRVNFHKGKKVLDLDFQVGICGYITQSSYDGRYSNHFSRALGHSLGMQ
jgi:hypothetical protein